MRFTAAALVTGLIGGAVTAAFWALVEVAESPAEQVLAVTLPVFLAGLIGWRLAGAGRAPGAAPGAWRLGALAAAGAATIAAALGAPQVDAVTGDLVHNLGVLLLVLFVGAVLGVVPAVAVALVGTVALRPLRRAPLPVAQLTLTLVAMAVTAGFALWAAPQPRSALVLGLATTLAGLGAALLTPWALAPGGVAHRNR
ncbi:hypothetical protein [Cryptosporangium japonicum]|uniref:Uncharacterized protein n=1 Tax=Cryptosporangium japonicum TaxID=80872 RepID=A0ABN0UKC4_9ACTN